MSHAKAQRRKNKEESATLRDVHWFIGFLLFGQDKASLEASPMKVLQDDQDIFCLSARPPRLSGSQWRAGKKGKNSQPSSREALHYIQTKLQLFPPLAG